MGPQGSSREDGEPKREGATSKTRSFELARVGGRCNIQEWFPRDLAFAGGEPTVEASDSCGCLHRRYELNPEL